MSKNKTAATTLEVEKILIERAALLARESNQLTTAAQHTVVEFKLENEHYGVEPSYISRVCLLKNRTLLPNLPTFIAGLINVYGRVVTVVDLKKLFELTETEKTDKKCVIVLAKDQIEIGILTDEVVGLRSFMMSELQPNIPTLSGVRTEFLAGITAEQLIILDAEKLLTDQRLIIDKEISA